MQGKVEICGVNTSKLQTLSNAEMMQLIERSQQGDMEARSRLVEGNLKLVLSVVQRFLSRGENPDDLFPTIYRVDRIQRFHITDEHFQVPYRERFQEGEFRKRVQFMYGGKLQKIRFKYTGPSIEAVLDRLPTAEIIEQDADGWTVEAEVFGKGVDMWLRSQGESIALIGDEQNGICK